MRVKICIDKERDISAVVEAVQMIQYKGGTVGFVLPYSEYYLSRAYNVYESTEPADPHDYAYWSDSLLRTGYLDLSKSKLIFNRYKTKTYT